MSNYRSKIISELLERANSSKEDKVSISCVMGVDECLVLGTESAYLRLAAEILQSIEDCQSEIAAVQDIEGVEIKNVGFGESISGRGGLALRSFFLADDEGDAAAASQYFFKLSG